MKIIFMTKERRFQLKDMKTIAILLTLICALLGICFMGTHEAASVEASISSVIFHKSKEASLYEFVDVSRGTTREVTAYNLIDEQTDDTPCIGASGDDMCERLDKGEKICAANFVPLRSKLYIDGLGECLVLDRMNGRFNHRVDIAMKENEINRAIKFGVQRLKVIIAK
jgi:3D (Asp-Asp-Asp) domain-containing protein